MRTRTTLAAFAVVAATSAQTFTTWTQADGLPSSDIRDVAVAPDGAMWMATAQGVARFDGSTFTVHNTTSHPGLASNDLYAIAVMANDQVWVGSDFGVSVFNGTAYTTYNSSNGLGDDQVKTVAQAPNGEVWIGTINGATRYNGSTFTAFGAPDIPFGGVLRFAFTPNGTVYMAGGLFGVIVYNGTSFSTLTTSDGLISNRIRAIAFDGEGNRWIATSDGISVLDANDDHLTDHLSVFILPPPDELNPITDIAVDEAGRVWAGVYVDYLVTEGGVSVYTDGTWDQYETSDGLAGPNVQRLALDDEGNLWVATSTGLTRMSGLNIGIAEEGQSMSFSLLPNPVAHTLSIAVEEEVVARLPYQVLDAGGRLVFQGSVAQRIQALDVSGLEPGIYLMRVGARTQRFVVAR